MELCALYSTVLYKEGQRLHIKTPYNFIKYSELYTMINNNIVEEEVGVIAEYSLSQPEMDKPILLGWSMSGDEYIRHNPLI